MRRVSSLSMFMCTSSSSRLHEKLPASMSFRMSFQAGFDGVEFFLRKQACLELGPRMGDGSGNVLAESLQS